MLYEDTNMREVLRRIVNRLCRSDFMAEDLMQEGLIHLWRLERRYPGQTRSWYLQGCHFHLRNELAAGRSLDAPKRNTKRLSTASFAEEQALLEQWEIETATEVDVGLEEGMRALSERLDAVEQTVLRDLMDGFGTTEIARKLQISHQAVSKRRKRIASIARQLGIRASSQRTARSDSTQSDAETPSSSAQGST